MRAFLANIRPKSSSKIHVGHLGHFYGYEAHEGISVLIPTRN
jgi:hypothetical protein